MNVYRITFRTIGEVNLKTILKAENDEEIRKEVNQMILNKEAFKEEGKNTRFFNVILTGISFIEYDLLHNEKNYYEKYEKLSNEELETLAERLTNPYIFATLSNDMPRKLHERILKVYPSNHKGKLEITIKDIWEVTQSDILEAKEMLNGIYVNIKKDKRK